jgi:hypothetical protein
VTVSNRTILQQDKYLGWKTLGAFVLTFVAGWIAGIIVGLATRQISLFLHLSEPIGHTFMKILAIEKEIPGLTTEKSGR